jgi:hypothetical protein
MKLVLIQTATHVSYDTWCNQEHVSKPWVSQTTLLLTVKSLKAWFTNLIPYPTRTCYYNQWEFRKV